MRYSAIAGVLAVLASLVAVASGSLVPRALADVRADYRICEAGIFDRMQRARKVPQPQNASEQYCLGLGYATGFGILPKDKTRAVGWYLKAAEAGNAGAQASLGYHYEKGYGVATNIAEAVKWYSKSAAQGYDDGMFHMYRVYITGRGVRKDEKVAQEWLQKAAKAGNAEARQILQEQTRNAPSLPGQDIFAKGKGLFDAKQYQASARLFEQAARMGNSRAQVFLGLQFDKGLGVPRNDATALYWYTLAAKQGHSTAQMVVGQMYEQGKGAHEDWAAALHWYELSAAQGDAEGLFALARMYQFGMGVPQDRYKAMAYFERAADQNNSKAGYVAKHLREGGCIGMRNQYEYDRWSAVCVEPTGIAFRNSQQRSQWLGQRAFQLLRAGRKASWQKRKTEYDECLREHKRSCISPGPEPD